MKLADFDYHLPAEAIAQEPLADRAASRMLVLHKQTKTWEDRLFRDLPVYLRAGDCLVVNDSKVLPSRLFGTLASSGRVEIFLLRAVSADQKTWQALVRPGRKMRTGQRVHIAEDFEAEILDRSEHGERTVRFQTSRPFAEALEAAGHMPLPPYIKRSDSKEDRERYQTVYAREGGSAAAPTAGLHFTPDTIEACRQAGATLARVTLHVGLGTFQPIHTEIIEEHKLHSESFEITPANAELIRSAQRRIAVGTTSVRALESAGLAPARGETSIFIYPGYEFRATEAMLTNFHLPKSSLLLLVCAFAGTEFVLAAYRHAIATGYRFYSYGDCMLII